MVADAILRYRLDNDSNNPELVLAIKQSAGTMYAGNPHIYLICVEFLKTDDTLSLCRDSSFSRSLVWRMV